MDILIGMGFGFAIFFLCFIMLLLASIRNKLDVIGQMVAIGMQRSGLVRTPEELAADTEAAEQDQDDIVL